MKQFLNDHPIVALLALFLVLCFTEEMTKILVHVK